jgi:GNAT superfamily N-acetyltransferase
MTQHANIPGLAIRAAAHEDVPLILALIRDLAEYARHADDVTATEASLRDSLFGARPAAEALIAEVSGQAAGYAIFFTNFSTWEGRPGIYLDDLYVRPAARGQGIGTRLLVHIARLAAQRGCCRFEWAVLDWNTPAQEFYTRLGAKAMSEWTIYRLAEADLEKLAGL